MARFALNSARAAHTCKPALTIASFAPTSAVYARKPAPELHFICPHIRRPRTEACTDNCLPPHPPVHHRQLSHAYLALYPQVKVDAFFSKPLFAGEDLTEWDVVHDRSYVFDVGCATKDTIKNDREPFRYMVVDAASAAIGIVDEARRSTKRRLPRLPGW